MHSGYYQDNSSKLFEGRVLCAIVRCDTVAEYQCLMCKKMYCDDHFRMHGHLEDNDDLR